MKLQKIVLLVSIVSITFFLFLILRKEDDSNMNVDASKALNIVEVAVDKFNAVNIKIRNKTSKEIRVPLFLPKQGNNGFMENRMAQGQFMLFLVSSDKLPSGEEGFILCSSKAFDNNIISLQSRQIIILKANLGDFYSVWGQGDVDFAHSLLFRLSSNDLSKLKFKLEIVNGENEKNKTVSDSFFLNYNKEENI